MVEGFRSEGAILDVGCANGLFLLALDPQRWRRVGIDVVREGVEVINRQVPGLQILLGDIHRSDLPLASFDVITFCMSSNTCSNLEECSSGPGPC